ncbi:hypothetical protein L6452_21892 [Arctium lappa]|uniref:Uncharacterized protein n=1 Tax=Arctium lappa TaxID=4217 RepID=A0ACB9AZ69_ARCLA|nr:hypothetical protein L6452_21892 [Arctium lappa]
MASSNEWCKLFPKSGESSRVYRFPIKDNNHMIQLDSPKFEEQYRVICKFFSNCELTQVLTSFTNECSLSFVQEFYSSSHYSDAHNGIIGEFDISQVVKCRILITPTVLREVLPLLTTEELEITHFEKCPTSETLLQFIRMLGYNTKITRLSNFRRQHLPPIWNFMFSVLNRTLTWKLGSMDQATPEILSIMYALFFNRNLDMAGIIFDMILTSIQKNCWIK